MSSIIYLPILANSKKTFIKDWPKIRKPQNFNFKPKNNIAIVCGKYSGISCADIDLKDGGMAKWEELIEKHGDPDTYVESTPSGGLHYVFKYEPFGFTKCLKLGKVGIDILSEDSYFLTVGSVIDNKPYKVVRGSIDKLSVMPDWLRTYIIQTAKPTTTTREKAEGILKPSVIPCKFNLRESDIRAVFDKIPIAKLTAFDTWLHFSYACKSENLEILWDEYSQLAPSYNKSKNIAIWNSITNPVVDINFVKTLIGEAKNPFQPYLEYIPYSQLPDKTLNVKYLDKEIYNGVPTVIVVSCTGTGKTTSVANYTKHKNVLSIVSRITLADAQADAFRKAKKHDFISYTALKDGITCAPNNFSVQLDSIAKFSYDYEDGYVVYLDEINSLISYAIQSDTLKACRRSVWNRLIQLVKEADQVIATDADVSELCLKWLKYIRPDMIFIENTFQNCNGIPAFSYANQYELIDKIKAVAAEGKHFTVCCDSKKNAEAIAEILREVVAVKDDVILYTSETASDTSNVNFSWQNKWVVYSPKITYGVDFVPNEAQDVFVWAKGNTITPLNIAQQIARTRKISNMHYVFENYKKTPKCLTYDDNKAYWAKNVAQSIDVFAQMSCLGSDETLLSENLFSTLFTLHDHQRTVFDTDPKRHFENLITAKGFIINHIESDEATQTQKDELSHAKDHIIERKSKMYDEIVKKNKCDDAGFMETIKDRWDVANVYNDIKIKAEYKETFIDNNEFQNHRTFLFACKDVKLSEKDFVINQISGTQGKISCIRLIETALKITPFDVDNVKIDEPAAFEGKAYALIKKLFRIRDNKPLPTKNVELLALYYKCLKALHIDVLKQDITRVSSGEKRRQYEHNYRCDTELLLKHFKLAAYKERGLEYIPNRIVELAYGEPADCVKERLRNEYDRRDEIQDLHRMGINC